VQRNDGLRKPESVHDDHPQGEVIQLIICSRKSYMSCWFNEVLCHGQYLFNEVLYVMLVYSLPVFHRLVSLSGEISENLHFGGQAGIVDVLKDLKESLNYHPRSWSDVHRQPASSSYGLIGNKIFTNAGSRESSLFSSSLSDMFSQKCKNLFHTC
jgi:hypothetical protein